MYNIIIDNLATISYNKKKQILNIKFNAQNIDIEKLKKLNTIIKQIVNNQPIILIVDFNGNYSKKIKNDIFTFLNNVNITHIIIINKNSIQNTLSNIFGPIPQLKKSVQVTIVKSIDEAIKLSHTLLLQQ